MIEIKDVISLIDEQIEFLKQQNGAGALMGMLKMFDDNKVKKVINTNNALIKELTDMRMKVLELAL
ncbi:hypothetical protein [Pseudolactococcus paracarnosus]|uniref:hypothetical protein n=1 Tax=Pseudolactococcus paracarnosus TaxID=2749962 RepID=UPI001FBBD765|nr:hypothetical protein [Lactococcus paracarnosus]MCJ1999227.1 hypothetical protein [Lactococcus paracarnosus]